MYIYKSVIYGNKPNVYQLVNKYTNHGISLNGIVFNDKKEQNTDTCYEMNVPQKHHSKSNKPDKKTTHCMIPFI